MAIPGKNSDLIRRFKFYGVGFALGLIAVSTLWKGKSCQSPAASKRDELSSKTLVYCNDSTCGITRAEIVELLGVWKTGTEQVVGTGEVNLYMSDPRAEKHPQPTFVVEGVTAKGKQLQIFIADCGSISKVVKALDLDPDSREPNDSCDCK